MIPRIIHYCWFSGDPYPPEVKKCIDSWHANMPDWEYVLWDYDTVASIDSAWLQECLSERKWAFAADFVRLYAVEKYGGVYLDTDVEIYRSIEPFLSHKAFIGRESTWHTFDDCNLQYLSSHCFGAEASHHFIKRCMSYYKDRHFILTSDMTQPESLRLSLALLPFIQTEFAREWGYDPDLKKDGPIRDFGDLVVYPSSYFAPCRREAINYCQHLCLGSWRQRHKKHESVTLLYRIRYHVNLWLVDIMWRLGYVINRK